MANQTSKQPKIVGFLCNWCCYGGADLCGVSRFQYPTYLRVIRIMCSGRVDLKFILQAFAKGADGVFIGGCHINDCHYNPQGNYDAWMLSKICKKLLALIGINPDRLRLEWVSAGEGIRFADIMNEFSHQIKALGPLGSSENIDEKTLAFRLESVRNLVPFVKLWERQRLRVADRSEAGFEKFFESKVLDTLFDRTIPDKLAVSQIMLLLIQKPLSTVDIAKHLELNQSDVARYMAVSSRHGLVQYDTAGNCYQRTYPDF